MEQSLNSKTKGRLHIHWKVDLAKSVDHSSTQAFAFHGVKPDARPTWKDCKIAPATGAKKARGATYEEARNRGHFYTWAPKVGSLHVDTDWAPFEKYRVNGSWPEDLWSDGKLDHDKYHDLSLRVRKGHANRKRDLQAVKGDEASARVDHCIAAANKALSKITAPFRHFDAVTEWENSFLTLEFRWKILVLCADTASGKSLFAEHLFDMPFCLTVEDAQFLDLKGFDREKNDGLVLDNVNSWGQLLKWRAVLQARNAKSKGGQSATNLYAYAQYLFGVAVVATVDLDAPDAHLVDPNHTGRSRWLLRDCTIVRLQPGECFFEKSKKPTEKVPNEFSLFAKTVKRRRAAQELEAKRRRAAQ